MKRYLCLILGDQLNRDSLIFEGFDPDQDCLWMAETLGESTHVPSHQQRSLMFLAAMRHFAEALRQEALPLIYWSLDDPQPQADFACALRATLASQAFQGLRVVLPGDFRVLAQLKQLSRDEKIPLEVLADRHFIALPGEFSRWAKGKKQLRMEYWYRQLRKRTGILMRGSQPEGGEWNYDKDNRTSFGKSGPGWLAPALQFPLDELTQGAMAAVARHFSHNPGSLVGFGWPVTRAQALQQLAFFIDNQLPLFGHYQDAMWTGEPWLYHSRLSAALNLKLLSPREVLLAAEQAYQAGRAPLNAVEGFVRQILGWREFVRGLYWLHMPQWREMNALSAHQPLPDFYWQGEVDMQCMAQSLGQVIRYGYGHHIQRLMVTGLFAQLWQVAPGQIHAWYLAMYVDAVEWVELPNVLGMSQYADDGLMASKPYIATGRYIDRMSNYCSHCPYQPDLAEGDRACPFTTLYWAFLEKHRERFAGHPRIGLQIRHLDAMPEARRAAIRARVAWLRARYSASGQWPLAT